MDSLLGIIFSFSYFYSSERIGDYNSCTRRTAFPFCRSVSPRRVFYYMGIEVSYVIKKALTTIVVKGVILFSDARYHLYYRKELHSLLYLLSLLTQTRRDGLPILQWIPLRNHSQNLQPSGSKATFYLTFPGWSFSRWTFLSDRVFRYTPLSHNLFLLNLRPIIVGFLLFVK